MNKCVFVLLLLIILLNTISAQASPPSKLDEQAQRQALYRIAEELLSKNYAGKLSKDKIGFRMEFKSQVFRLIPNTSVLGLAEALDAFSGSEIAIKAIPVGKLGNEFVLSVQFITLRINERLKNIPLPKGTGIPDDELIRILRDIYRPDEKQNKPGS